MITKWKSGIKSGHLSSKNWPGLSTMPLTSLQEQRVVDTFLYLFVYFFVLELPSFFFVLELPSLL